MSSIIRAANYMAPAARQSFAAKHKLKELEVGDVVVFEGKSTYSNEYTRIMTWFNKHGKRGAGRSVGGNLHVQRIE